MRDGSRGVRPKYIVRNHLSCWRRPLGFEYCTLSPEYLLTNFSAASLQSFPRRRESRSLIFRFSGFPGQAGE